MCPFPVSEVDAQEEFQHFGFILIRELKQHCQFFGVVADDLLLFIRWPFRLRDQVSAPIGVEKPTTLLK
jgi:hypothetical protein